MSLSNPLIPGLAALAACAPTGPERYAPLYEGGLSYEEADAFLASLPYSRIVADYRPYFMAGGGQEQYRVTYGRDGQATLHGRVGDSGWADFEGQVDLWDYGRLCELIELVEIEDLEDDYEAPWFHGATFVLRLEDEQGLVKRIEDYGSIGPSALWAVKSAAEAVQHRIDWERVESSPPAGSAAPSSGEPEATEDDERIEAGG